MRKYEKYTKRAKELGARGAKIILAKSIVTAEWVRLKCQYGCGLYGERLTCPPYSPTPEVTRKMLVYYKNAILIGGDEKTDIGDIVATLEREIFLDGYYKAFGMACGPCELCVKCARSCRSADKARPSMEACGVDVYATVRANGFPIQVLKTANHCGNYYGVILID